MTQARCVLAFLPLASVVLGACVAAGSPLANCGQQPAVERVAPSPVESTMPAATTEQAVVIGVWSDCFQPAQTSARLGQLVQWQAAELGITTELVLEDGTSLGRVQHVLEFHFTRPGTYRYHARNAPLVTGTIEVR